jgi:hypothetical protein
MPAIRKLLSNYLPNIFDMGASPADNNNDINMPSFATRSAPSLYPTSTWSIDVNGKRMKARFTGDGDIRLEADGIGIPDRDSLEVSLVSRGRC